MARKDSGGGRGFVDGSASEGSSDEKGRPRRYEDSSEEDDDADEFEKDDFLVGDEDEEEGGDGDDGDEGSDSGGGRHRRSGDDGEGSDSDSRHGKHRRRKRRKRASAEPEFLEGDHLLLQEQGVKLPRHKMRRLHRMGGNESADDDDLGLDDGDGAPPPARQALNEDVDYESDEFGDFIDDGPRGGPSGAAGNGLADDDDDEDDDGGGLSRGRRAPSGGGGQGRRGGPSGRGVDAHAVQAAMDIFGDMEEVDTYKGGRDNDDDDDDRDYMDGDDHRRSDRMDRDGSDRRADGTDPSAAGLATVDPALAAERYMTKADAEIRSADLPEALQAHFGTRSFSEETKPTDEELQEAAGWVYDRAFATDPHFAQDAYPQADMVTAIRKSLSFLIVDGFDVPYIAVYKREHISILIWEASATVPPGTVPPRPYGFNAVQRDDGSGEAEWGYEEELLPSAGYDDTVGDWTGLWRVYDWAAAWRHLLSRRKAVMASIESSPAGLLGTEQKVALLGSVRQAVEETEIDDAERSLRHAAVLASRMSNGAGEPELERLRLDGAADLDADVGGTGGRRPARGGRQRRPRRQARLHLLGKRKVGDFARTFAISAEQLSENLDKLGPVNKPNNPLEVPLTAASSFSRERLDERLAASAVLAGARDLLIEELVNHAPLVNIIRRQLMEDATVWSMPTQLATETVDDTHPLRPYVSVAAMPLQELAASPTFALMTRAEELHLTTVHIVFRDEKPPSPEKVAEAREAARGREEAGFKRSERLIAAKEASAADPGNGALSEAVRKVREETDAAADEDAELDAEDVETQRRELTADSLELVSLLLNMYSDDNDASTSNSSALWHAQRARVITALYARLARRVADELRRRLTRDAAAVLQERLTSAASRRLLVGPASIVGVTGAPRVLALTVTHEVDEPPSDAHRGIMPTPQGGHAAVKLPGNRGGGGGPATSTRRGFMPRITFASVDSDGRFVASGELSGVFLRRRRDEPPEPAAEAGLLSAIQLCKPHYIVVGIGSGGKDAVRLRDDMVAAVAKLIRDGDAHGVALATDAPTFVRNFEAFGMDADKIDPMTDGYRHAQSRVGLVDDAASRLYAETSFCRVGLPSIAVSRPLVRRAIGLARCAVEPLDVLAGVGADRLAAPAFRLHPLHYLVPVPGRIEALRRGLVRAVAATGFDVNSALLRAKHRRVILRFVSGVGERKAAGFWAALDSSDTGATASASAESGVLYSRRDIFDRKLLGRVVFISAVGFLRVRDPELHRGGSQAEAIDSRRTALARRPKSVKADRLEDLFDPLDDSRVHPEEYLVAIKIAEEALRDDEAEPEASRQKVSAKRSVAAVMEAPGGLAQLDLAQYAGHLKKAKRGEMKRLLELICVELSSHQTYKDPRQIVNTAVRVAPPPEMGISAPTVSYLPGPRAVFYIASGLDPRRYCVGAKVTASDVRLTATLRGVSVQLEGGVRGFLLRENVAGKELQDDELRAMLPTGSSLSCRILNIRYREFEAALTSVPSVVAKPDAMSIPGYKEPDLSSHRFMQAYVPKSDRRKDVLLAGGRPSRARRLPRKAISHPLYQTVTGVEAMRELDREGESGDVIIRPSVRSVDKVIFTAKVADNQPFANVEVTEVRDTPGGDVTGYAVGQERFMDLDEVLGRYVQMMVTNLVEAMDHRKFVMGSKADLEAKLRADKAKAPSMRPYAVGASWEESCRLVLAYIPGERTIVKELITVLPDGYRLRSVLHPDLDHLFDWFKRNMATGGPLAAPAASRTPLAAYSRSVRTTPLVVPAPSPGRPALPPTSPRVRSAAAAVAVVVAALLWMGAVVVAVAAAALLWMGAAVVVAAAARPPPTLSTTASGWCSWWVAALSPSCTSAPCGRGRTSSPPTPRSGRTSTRR